MNEERLEREKNKRIKLNGTTSTEHTTTSNSQSTSSHTSQTHPTSSNGNATSNGNSSTAAAKKATTNGTAEKQEDKKEIAKLHPKMSKLLSTSGKRIQKELAEITLDPPPNCRLVFLKTFLIIFL